MFDIAIALSLNIYIYSRSSAEVGKERWIERTCYADGLVIATSCNCQESWSTFGCAGWFFIRSRLSICSDKKLTRSRRSRDIVRLRSRYASHSSVSNEITDAGGTHEDVR